MDAIRGAIIDKSYGLGSLEDLVMIRNTTCDILERRVIELERECSEHRQAQEVLKASLREKEVLLREIHHRVKNNMQVISSLLSLQEKEIQDQRLKTFVQESQSRIRAMSLIHEELCRSPDLLKISLEDYICRLADSMIRLYCAAPVRIAVKVYSEALTLRYDVAVSCGLIISELISNALKYAFPTDRMGEIQIEARSLEDDEIMLAVSDNGVGIPKEVDIRRTGTLGLELVTSLVEKQLGGRLETQRENGTRFIIRFKLS